MLGICRSSHRASLFYRRRCKACGLEIPRRSPEAGTPTLEPVGGVVGDAITSIESVKSRKQVDLPPVLKVVAVTVSFPRPVAGAVPNPVKAEEARLGLRRTDCDRQSGCLTVAVKEGWGGLSCAECTGYVPEPKQALRLRKNNGMVDE